MRKYGRILLMAVLVAGLATSALAHEMVLKPGAEKDGKLAVELHSGHKFIVPEEVESVERIKAGLFKDGALQEAELKGNDAELRIDFSVPVQGTSIIIANKDGGVWSRTNEGGKSGTRKELEAQGLKVLSAVKYDKFVKLIHNPSKDDTSFATVTGQALELIPETNPADLKVGDFLKVKIMVNGNQPYSGPVWATWDGFAPEVEETYAYYTVAAQGEALIKITAPGLWGIRAMKSDLPGKEGEYDALSLRSFLMFEVK
ncbi:MAG: DUF4198 domain-containing protein [Fretibacterium sp.]|nr:DUF4198 domain-containing protein [Fretibacterium sp.]